MLPWLPWEHVVLDKGIEIPASVQEGDEQGQDQKGGADRDAEDVHFGELSAGVPGALGTLAEATQFHGVGDGFDAVQGGENQGNQNGAGGFQPVYQAGLFAHFRTPGLLGQGDVPVFPLDIGDIPQGQRHGVADR